MSYEYQPYPKVLYHATEEPRVVADAAAHDALGAEWAESPEFLTQGRSEADRQAHTLEATGSSPVPASIPKRGRPAKRAVTPVDPAVE